MKREKITRHLMASYRCLMNRIDEFDGEYRFLSNFFPCNIRYNGLLFLSSEAAFQAAKCKNKSDQLLFQYMSAADSKHAGKRVKLREDWERVKTLIMSEVVHAKFSQNKMLRDLLIATGDAELLEGNAWGDTVWGVCNGVGDNKLGKILMEERKLYAETKDI